MCSSSGRIVRAVPGHPARGVARQHKTATERWFAELLARAGVRSSLQRGREVALLMEGALSLILIHGDVSYAEAAASAAKRLVKSG